MNELFLNNYNKFNMVKTMKLLEQITRTAVDRKGENCNAKGFGSWKGERF